MDTWVEYEDCDCDNCRAYNDYDEEYEEDEDSNVEHEGFIPDIRTISDIDLIEELEHRLINEKLIKVEKDFNAYTANELLEVLSWRGNVDLKQIHKYEGNTVYSLIVRE